MRASNFLSCLLLGAIIWHEWGWLLSFRSDIEFCTVAELRGELGRRRRDENKPAHLLNGVTLETLKNNEHSFDPNTSEQSDQLYRKQWTGVFSECDCASRQYNWRRRDGLNSCGQYIGGCSRWFVCVRNHCSNGMLQKAKCYDQMANGNAHEQPVPRFIFDRRVSLWFRTNQTRRYSLCDWMTQTKERFQGSPWLYSFALKVFNDTIGTGRLLLLTFIIWNSQWQSNWFSFHHHQGFPDLIFTEQHLWIICKNTFLLQKIVRFSKKIAFFWSLKRHRLSKKIFQTLDSHSTWKKQHLNGFSSANNFHFD